MEFQLRDYQRECLEIIDNKLKSGGKYLSVVMTTGLGIKLMYEKDGVYG